MVGNPPQSTEGIAAGKSMTGGKEFPSLRIDDDLGRRARQTADKVTTGITPAEIRGIIADKDKGLG